MSRKKKSKPAAPTISSRLVGIVRLLTAISASISAYLLITSLRGGSLIGCGAESGCEGVLTSPWAYWFGLPVSAPGTLAYAGMFAATFFLRPTLPPERQRLAWIFLVALAWLVPAAALWFVGVQLFVLRHVCPYCLVAHACGIASSVLILHQAPVARPGQAPAGKQNPRSSLIAAAMIPRLAGASLAAFALLVAGSWINRPPTFKVQAAGGGRPGSGAAPAVTAAIPGKGRVIDLFDGAFKVHLDEVPLIGRPAAPDAMVSLFDYTCHHCRQMHPLLVAAQQVHGRQLVIANLPMPLDGHCNSLMKRTPAPHTNACEYARLGLAVWRADRTKIAAYDSWIFEPPTPPPLDEARAFAGQLVGEEALQRALSDPWVERQLQQDISIYQANYKNFGNSAMPQLMLGTNIIFGIIERPADLEQSLVSSFGWH